MSSRFWYDCHDNRIGLATWLDDQGAFADTKAMLRFFEKPWKWRREFALYELHRTTNSQWVRSQCEAAIDTERTAEQIREGTYDTED